MKVERNRSHASLLVVVLAALVAAVTAQEVEPKDLCKLSVGSNVFNLTGLKNHEDLAITKMKNSEIQTFKIISSLCSPVTLEDIKSRYPQERHGLIKYSPAASDVASNVVVVKEDPYTGALEAFDLAFSSSGQSSSWRAKYEDPGNFESRSLQGKNNPSLELSYNVTENNKSVDIGIKAVAFKFVCLEDDDFDFFDQRVVGSTLILQYSGAKACSIDQPILIDKKWSFAMVLLVLTSIYGLSLDKDNERLVMTLSSVQGAFMTVVAVYIAFGRLTGDIGHEKDLIFEIFGVAFMFLAIGMSYFIRYVSISFVCVASSFAINCTFLYLSCLVFRVGIPTWLFYIGGLASATVLWLLLWFSTSFREKYSFTILSATTNSFYLCSALAYATDWVINMFTYNKFKSFGKEESIEFKHWTFLLLQLTITAVVVSFRVHQARKTKEEAILKNASLFLRKPGLTGDIDGYIEPDRGDEDPLTVIAM